MKDLRKSRIFILQIWKATKKQTKKYHSKYILHKSTIACEKLVLCAIKSKSNLQEIEERAESLPWFILLFIRLGRAAGLFSKKELGQEFDRAGTADDTGLFVFDVTFESVTSFEANDGS